MVPSRSRVSFIVVGLRNDVFYIKYETCTKTCALACYYCRDRVVRVGVELIVQTVISCVLAVCI